MRRFGENPVKHALKLRWFLLLSVVGANLLVMAMSWAGMSASRQHYEQRTDIRSQNIAVALDHAVSKSVEKIDLVLHAIASELERETARGGIDARLVEDYLDKTVKRMPELEAIRIVNADGLVFLGNSDRKLSPQSVTDRDYFTYLRDHTDKELFVSEPLFGRMVNHHIIIFAKRFNRPDGTFGGVAYATVAVSHFTELLAKFDVGPNGTIVLRDSKLSLVTRLPAIPNSPAGRLGNNLVSPEFRSLVTQGIRLSTFHTTQASDGNERTVTFRGLESAPFYAIVGLATQDYLQDWWQEVYKTLAFVVFFLLISTASAVAILRLLKQAEVREARIHALSFYDALTGLPGLRLAEDRLNMALSQARRQGDKAGLMFIDLDGFKNINDVHGHDAGDQILKEVARRIQQTIRANDTAARIGGDEILVILGSLADVQAAAEVAGKIIAAVATPIDWNGKALSVGCSIGISVYPDDAQDAQSLRIKADTAMYSVKRSGKNSFAVYSDHLTNENCV